MGAGRGTSVATRLPAPQTPPFGMLALTPPGNRTTLARSGATWVVAVSVPGVALPVQAAVADITISITTSAVTARQAILEQLTSSPTQPESRVLAQVWRTFANGAKHVAPAQCHQNSATRTAAPE